MDSWRREAASDVEDTDRHTESYPTDWTGLNHWPLTLSPSTMNNKRFICVCFVFKKPNFFAISCYELHVFYRTSTMYVFTCACVCYRTWFRVHVCCRVPTRQCIVSCFTCTCVAEFKYGSIQFFVLMWSRFRANVYATMLIRQIYWFFYVHIFTWTCKRLISTGWELKLIILWMNQMVSTTRKWNWKKFRIASFLLRTRRHFEQPPLAGWQERWKRELYTRWTLEERGREKGRSKDGGREGWREQGEGGEGRKKRWEWGGEKWRGNLVTFETWFAAVTW